MNQAPKPFIMQSYTRFYIIIPLFFSLLLVRAQKTLSVQNKIDSSFQACFIQKSSSPLILLDKSLLANESLKSDYWRAYLHYHLAVYLSETNEKALAEEMNDLGIDLLMQRKSKSSEDHALLALMESFSISFKKGAAFWITQRVKKNAQKALEKDSLNLRAYFVLGSNDFYTPKQFGGMKKAERYLKKAVLLGKQNSKTNTKPNWGHSMSYELLVKLLLKQNQPQKAIKWAKEGLRLYPDHFPLKMLNDRLKTK